MKSRTRVLILCLLCVVHASKVLSEEITEFDNEKISVQGEDLSRNLTREINGTDGQAANKLRDKRALGLLLSGLAQLFGYTVTPIQYASLPNPPPPPKIDPRMDPHNPPNPHNPHVDPHNNNKDQLIFASAHPNHTPAPRLRETLRFTGVVNFGNRSDILGHLRRYEQIFHGDDHHTTTTTTHHPHIYHPHTHHPPVNPPPTFATTPIPMPHPHPHEDHFIDPRMSLPTKPPLLTPFFVKIPLPIAPNLLPITSTEDLTLSHPIPLKFNSMKIKMMSESSEDLSMEMPIRKEQETIFRKNKNIERYMVKNKEIFDEKDVMKPIEHTQMYIDEPSFSKQQDERYNEVQRIQEKHVARIKGQQVQRNRDQDNYDREDEIDEKHRNREEEIVNRNREHASKYSSSEERRPAYDDEENEESAGDEERANQPNRSNESSERTAETDEREKNEDYDNDKPGKQSDRYKQDNDKPDKQSDEYKQDDDQPSSVDYEKYVEVNQQLPIGDYFHESNSEEIRDSYGEVLNNKNMEDDRLSGYFSMFKQPYVDEFDYQQVQDPENAQEDERKEMSKETDSYDEHLTKLQKLREEYALSAPESKYEEYDINDEDEANRNDRQNERDENRAAAKSKKPKTERIRGKENIRAKTTSELSRNQFQRESEEAKPQEELDLAKYTPLIVPVRYVDVSDRSEEASTRQLKYNTPETRSDDNQDATSDNVDPATEEKPTPQIASLPEKPRQLHEGEHKEFQLWPPPFDYAFDNTERTNAIVPVNPSNYPANYYRNIVTNIADNDASNNSSEQPTGYLLVVDDPVQSYQHSTNVYYFSKDAVTSPNPESHLNAEDAHAQHQLDVPQQNADQQSTEVNPNPTEYNYNETTMDHPHQYYESQEAPADVFNRYKYEFGEYDSEVSEVPSIVTKTQLAKLENWSNKIYPSQRRNDGVVDQPPPALAQEVAHNVASSNENVQNVPPEGQHYSQLSRRRKNSQTEDQRQDNRKAKAPPRQSVPKRKPFHDPQSAHDFFGFSKNDYSFDGESGNASKVAEENGKNTTESRVFVAPEPTAYHHDESMVKHTDEPENDTEKAVVREYRNRVATLRASEQRRSTPNGPTHYVNYTRNI